MNKIKLIIATFALILIGCSDDDPVSSDAATFTGTGTYTLSTATIHTSGDCSDDNGTSGTCWPPLPPVSESNCVETGTAMCMDANTGDGIIGDIETEAACTGDDKIWIIIGWNLWASILLHYDTITFSDNGTYTDWADESGTWTLDGTTLTMTDSEDEVFTATVSGNTLTFEIEDAIISDHDCGEMVFTK